MKKLFSLMLVIVTVCLLTTPVKINAQSESSSMEYKVEKVSVSAEEQQKILDEYSNSGWKLVNVIERRNEVFFYFEREK